MIKSKDNIQSILQKNKPKLVNLGVKKLGVFDSARRGEMTEKSDIDFLVEFKRGQKTFDNFMELLFLLEQLLKNRIDLITPEALSNNLKQQIYKEVDFIEIG